MVPSQKELHALFLPIGKILDSIREVGLGNAGHKPFVDDAC